MPILLLRFSGAHFERAKNIFKEDGWRCKQIRSTQLCYVKNIGNFIEFVRRVAVGIV